jgi:hypothetical protein
MLSVANLGTDIAVLQHVWNPPLKPAYANGLGVNASNVTATFRHQPPEIDDKSGSASQSGSGSESESANGNLLFFDSAGEKPGSHIFAKSSGEIPNKALDASLYHATLLMDKIMPVMSTQRNTTTTQDENELLNGTDDSSTPTPSGPKLANRSAMNINITTAPPNASYVPPFIDNYASVWEIETLRKTALTLLFVPHMIIFLHMGMVWYNERIDAARNDATMLLVYMLSWLIVGPILIVVVEIMLCTFLMFIPDFDFIALWFPGFVAFYADARPMSEAFGACIPQLCLCFALYARTQMIDNLVLIPYPLFLVSITCSILCLTKSSYFILHSRYGGFGAYWNEVTASAESEADNVPYLDDIINSRTVEVDYTGYNHLSYRDWKAVGRGLGYSGLTESFIAQNCRLEARLCKTLCQGFARCIYLRCLDLCKYTYAFLVSSLTVLIQLATLTFDSSQRHNQFWLWCSVRSLEAWVNA